MEKRMNELIQAQINSNENPMGSLSGSRDKYLGWVPTGFDSTFELLTSEMAHLEKELRVAAFRAAYDPKYLKDDVFRLEKVASKLTSTSADDIIAPRTHFFTFPDGNRYKSTVFEYDELMQAFKLI